MLNVVDNLNQLRKMPDGSENNQSPKRYNMLYNIAPLKVLSITFGRRVRRERVEAIPDIGAALIMDDYNRIVQTDHNGFHRIDSGVCNDAGD